MVHVLRLYRLLLSAVAAHLWIVTAVTVTRMIQVLCLALQIAYHGTDLHGHATARFPVRLRA